MTNAVIVNDELTDRVSVYDRGLAYGDGVFETILVQDGRLRFWDMHFKRLTRSLTQLNIRHKLISNDLLATINKHLSHESEQIVKIIVTRGNSQRGYMVPEDISANTIIYISDNPGVSHDWSKTGIKAKFCETRLGYQTKLAGLKHLNRLEQILARLELANTDYQEGIMLGYHGEVIEGIMHNLFLVKNGELFTPDLSQCGVAGIMRTFIIENSQQWDIPVHVTQVTVEQLLAADELFFTNSINVIWPICELDNARFKVGEVTSLLSDKVVEKMYQNA